MFKDRMETYFSTFDPTAEDHASLRQWIKSDQELHNKDPEFVFFWGGVYSQWAHSPIVWDGKHFPTAEHFMMYHKYMTFNDTERAKQVFKYNDPRIGRQIEDYVDEVWAEVRYGVVVMGSILKFSQNPELLDVLRQDYMVDGKILVEASPYDRIWGIGRSEFDPGLENIDNWDGENLLGYAIMEAGERLKGFGF